MSADSHSSTPAPPTSMPFIPPSPSHKVHFENTCVIIPEEPEHTGIHLLKRSYALPSWGRRQRPDDPDTPPTTITVRVPSITLKHRRRHSAERSSLPLQPCLRHSHSVSCTNNEDKTDLKLPNATFEPPLSPGVNTLHEKRHKTPSSRRTTLTGTPVDRVPLRECCTTCLETVNKALDHDYHEHWSKGAERRRRVSDSELPGPSTSTNLSSSFLSKPVKVDEVEVRKYRGRPPPKRLPPAMLENLCSDEDETLLFPLPSPRRTPLSGTPTCLTPSGTPPSRTPSPHRTPSPFAIAAALDRSREEKDPPLTGKALLANLPDVDVLPSRRAASDSATETLRTKKSNTSLLRTLVPPSSFTPW